MAWISLNGESGGWEATAAHYNEGTNTWILVGESGDCKVSYNNFFSIQHTSITSNYLYGIAYGNSRWVTVGAPLGGKPIVFISITSGASWIQTTIQTTGTINCIAFGNGVFVVGDSLGNIFSSSDGVFWFKRNNVFGANSVNWVIFANNQFVAVGNGGKIATSPDGIAWTGQTSGATNPFYGIGYGDGVWVAVGALGMLRKSTDNGITWSAVTSGFGSSDIRGVAFGGGKWVTVGNDGKTYVSTNDAVTWTVETNVFGGNMIRTVVYGDGRFLSLGSYGTNVYASQEARRRYRETPQPYSIGVAGYVYSGGYVESPQTQALTIQGGTPVLSDWYGFSNHHNTYEGTGLIAAIANSKPQGSAYDVSVVYAAQGAYDYDDGTADKNTVMLLASTVSVASNFFKDATNGFITNDSFGSPAFLDGLLVGIASSMVEEKDKNIDPFGGGYGAIGFDVMMPYYMDFVESIVGESVPGRDAAQPNNLYLKRSFPEEFFPVNLTVTNLEGVGLISYYEVVFAYAYTSTDGGDTWSRGEPSILFDQAACQYPWFSRAYNLDGRFFLAYGSEIKYSDDDGATWVTVHTAARTITSVSYWTKSYYWYQDGYTGTSILDRYDVDTSVLLGVILRHPTTGVMVCVGKSGWVYSSEDEGLTWSEIQLTTAIDLELSLDSKTQTFFANGSSVWSSTNGIDWVKRNTLPATNPSIRRVGDLLITGTYNTYISTDNGASWVNMTSIISPLDSTPADLVMFYGGGVYFFSNSVYTCLIKSYDGRAWTRCYDAEMLFDIDGTNVLYAYGNGLHVFMTDYYGRLIISADNANTFQSYVSETLGDIDYSGLFYWEVNDVWVAYATNSCVMIAKDPRGVWTRLSITSYSGQSVTINSCSEVPGRLVFGATQDVYALIDPLYEAASYVPVYPSKPQPYAASGLIGYTCTKGGSYSQASGTVLQDGLHILTVAHGVYGITSGEYSTFEFFFNVPNGVTIAQPTVVGVTIHSSYSPTAQSSGWINYDIAIIHLAEPIDSRVSRYEMFSGTDTIPTVFDKIAYGHGWDPVLGISEADALHFIPFQNRYEAYGQSLIALGYTYIESGKHLLYDYDDGTTATDVIGQALSGSPNTGLGITEGFTAPGRSGSAGIVNGKIYGITWGNVSVAPFDIEPDNQGTYGEIGIDLRASAFASWVSVAADFGLDVIGTLPGFSSELEFSPPIGFQVNGLLDYPTGSMLASEPDQFASDNYLPGLDSDFAMLSPWQATCQLPPMLCDMQLAQAETVGIDNALNGLSLDFSSIANGSMAIEYRLPSLVSGIGLEISNHFEFASMLSLRSDISIALAGEFSFSSIMPTLSASIEMIDDFAIDGRLPGISSDLSLYAIPFSLDSKLPELQSDIGIEGHSFDIQSMLLSMVGEMAMEHRNFEASGSITGLIGSLSLASSMSFGVDVGLLAQLVSDIQIDADFDADMVSEAMLPGLQGFVSAKLSNPSCSTRYL